MTHRRRRPTGMAMAGTLTSVGVSTVIGPTTPARIAFIPDTATASAAGCKRSAGAPWRPLPFLSICRGNRPATYRRTEANIGFHAFGAHGVLAMMQRHSQLAELRRRIAYEDEQSRTIKNIGQAAGHAELAAHYRGELARLRVYLAKQTLSGGRRPPP